MDDRNIHVPELVVEAIYAHSLEEIHEELKAYDKRVLETLEKITA